MRRLLFAVILSTTVLAVCTLARPQFPSSEGASSNAKTTTTTTAKKSAAEAAGRLPATSRGQSPLSCSSAACHGRHRAKNLPVNSSNSFEVWLNGTSLVGPDPHVRAYDSLRRFAAGQPGYEIARRMDSEYISAKKVYREFLWENCSGCHAPSVKKPPSNEPPSNTVAKSDANTDQFAPFGVSCESCHGDNSQAWLYEHTLKPDDTSSQNEHERKMDELGFRSLGTSEQKMAVCRDCHVGALTTPAGQKRVVDHELIAAGHPRLNADLADYFSRLPKHWKPDTAPTETQLWFVGQQKKLDRELELLAAEMSDLQSPNGGAIQGGIPDFAHMDCYACHHTIQHRSRARQANDDHPFGSPAIGSSYDLFFQTVPLDDASMDIWRAIHRAGLDAPMPSVENIRRLQSAVSKIEQPTSAELLDSMRDADVGTNWDSAQGWWHAWSAHSRDMLAIPASNAARIRRDQKRLQGHFQDREYPRQTRGRLKMTLSPVDFDMQSFLTDRETAVSP